MKSRNARLLQKFKVSCNNDAKRNTVPKWNTGEKWYTDANGTLT